MAKRSLVRALGACVLVLGACSDSNTGATDGGQNPAGDQGSGAADLSAAKRGTGGVTLTSQSFAAGASTFKSSSAYAYFAAAAASSGAQCTETTSGACKVTKCQPSSANPDAGTPTYPHAGAITITGGTKMATLTPTASGTYGAYSDNTSTLWNGGETLTVTAAGNANGVPAFSGTVTGPVSAKLTSPTAPAAGTKLMVSRAADFKLVWTGGAGGNVQVSFSQNAGGAATIVACTFPGADGMGTVPSAALGNLAAADGSFIMYSNSTKLVAAGNYDVTVTAQLTSTASNNSLAAFTATYQ